MKSTVMDSYAVIVYLERERGYQTVVKQFDECVLGKREILLCVVNWGEVIYHALRSGGEKTARLSEEVMNVLPMEIIPVDNELTRLAAHLKAYNKMSYADCFAAALAIKNKCELLTGDKEFKQIRDKLKIRWIE